MEAGGGGGGEGRWDSGHKGVVEASRKRQEGEKNNNTENPKNRKTQTFDLIGEIPWSLRENNREYGAAALLNSGEAGFLSEDVIEALIVVANQNLEPAEDRFQIARLQDTRYANEQARNQVGLQRGTIVLPRIVAGLRDQEGRARRAKRLLAGAAQPFLFPCVENGNHWILIVADINTKRIHIVDSLSTDIERDLGTVRSQREAQFQLGGAQRTHLASLVATIITEAVRDHQEHDTTWRVCVSSGLQQTDSYNCGVFVLLHLLLIAKTPKQTQHQDFFNTGRHQGVPPNQQWLARTRHLLLDGLWGGGLEQVHMRETTQCICRALQHAQDTGYKEWQAAQLTLERIHNQMERREDGQERDARQEERGEDEQEQGGQGPTNHIAVLPIHDRSTQVDILPSTPPPHPPPCLISQPQPPPPPQDMNDKETRGEEEPSNQTKIQDGYLSHHQWATGAEEQILTAGNKSHAVTTDRSEQSAWVEMHRKDNAPGNIISQNVNGCSQFVLKHILGYLIETYQPSVVLLQEVRVGGARKETDLRTMIKKEWGSYRVFMTKGSAGEGRKGKSDLRLVTLVHADLLPRPPSSPSGTAMDSGAHQKRIQVLQIGKKESVLLYNIHMPVATEEGERDSMWKALSQMLKPDPSIKLTIIGGDFNASRRHPEIPMRVGYGSNSSVHRADERMEQILHELGRSQTVTCEKMSRSSTHFTFSTWYKQGHHQAKLDHVFAFHNPSCTVNLISKTAEDCIIGAAVDHRALVVNVSSLNAEGEQAIPKIEILPQWRDREATPCRKKKVVEMEKLAGRLGVEWAIALDEKIKAAQALHQDCDILELITTALPTKEIPLRGSGGKRHASKLQMDLKRKIKQLHQDLRSASEIPDFIDRAHRESSLNAEIRENMTKFKEICAEQDQEIFLKTCEQRRRRLGTIGSKESQSAMGKKSDFKPKAPMLSHLPEKCHPNTIELTSWRDLQPALQQPETEYLQELTPLIETFLQNSSAKSSKTFWNAKHQTMLHVEALGARNQATQKLSITLAPAHSIVPIIQELTTQPGGWRLEGYKNIEQFLPMRMARDLEDETHTATFFAVNGCTMNGVCARAECQTKGRLIPLYDKRKHNEEPTILFFCKSCQSFTSVKSPDFEPPEHVNQLPTRDVEIAYPLEPGEIQVWIQKLANRKAAGMDLISNEILKALPDSAKEEIGKIISRALTGDKQTLRMLARVRLLPKNEFCHILENQRPICVLSSVTRIFQAVIAHRLAKAAERHKLLTNNQEGFRPEGGTIRQGHRLLNIIEEAQSNQTNLILLYLDFANFFNNVAVESIAKIMEVYGFHQSDVDVTISCSQGIALQIQTERFETAAIPLLRGLPQGSPASPPKTNLLLSILSRQLDQQQDERATQHPNNLSFADDLVLIAHSVREMKTLVQVVERFCRWSGLELNTKKSEITSFDYRLKREIPGTQNIKFFDKEFVNLKPTKWFKYLGIRISLWRQGGRGNRLQTCPFTWGEKQHILEKTKELTNLIESSAYSAAQKYYLVKVGIVNIFRYSAVLVSWTWKDLQTVDTLWTRAFKRAMGLRKSTSNAIFHLPWDRGGLQLPHPAPILGRMAIKYLEKETNKKCRVDDDIKSSLINKLTSWCTQWGCQTIGQLQREIRSGRIKETEEIRGPERLAVWIAERMKTTISWEMIESKMKPGTIAILHDIEDQMLEENALPRDSEENSLPASPAREGWESFAKAWRQLPQIGYHSRTSILPIPDTEGISLHLPMRLWPFPKQREQAEEILAKYLQANVIWAKLGQEQAGVGKRRRPAREEGQLSNKKRKGKREASPHEFPPPKKLARPDQGREETNTKARTRRILRQLLQHDLTYYDEGGDQQERFNHTSSNIPFKVQGNIAIFERPQNEENKTLDPPMEWLEASLDSAPFTSATREEDGNNRRDSIQSIHLMLEIVKALDDGETEAKWWEQLEEAVSEVRQETTQPLAYEFLQHLAEITECDISTFRNWPTLYTHPQALGKQRARELHRAVIWMDKQERFREQILDTTHVILIGWKNNIDEIPEGFEVISRVPKGAQIAYAANFWRTGNRCLMRTAEELWVLVKHNFPTYFRDQLHDKILPTYEELCTRRRDQIQPRSDHQSGGHFIAAIEGNITQSRKNRSMRIGYVLQQQEMTSGGGMKINGKCSIIRANTIAIGLLLQHVLEEGIQIKRGNQITIIYQSTRFHRFTTNTLRMDTMRYEDELLEDLYDRLLTCTKKLEGRGIQIRLQLAKESDRHIQEAKEMAKQGKQTFASGWEKAIYDSAMEFIIAGEENPTSGMDRLKKWDYIIRQQAMNARIRAGDLTLTEKFMLEIHVGRELLGKAFRQCQGSVTRTAIQAITFSAPTRKKLFQWGKTNSPCCPHCPDREETWGHIQLACRHFQDMIQKGHNEVMKKIKVRLQQSWRKQRLQVNTWWETPMRIVMEAMGTTIHQEGQWIPDGCCYFTNIKRLVLIEFARTSEYDGVEQTSLECLRKKFQEKEEKYAHLRAAIIAILPDHEVEQATFIAGVKGSIMEREWHENFRVLRVEETEWEGIKTAAIKQLLEVQHMLWKVRREREPT